MARRDRPTTPVEPLLAASLKTLKEAIADHPYCSGTYKPSPQECILFYGKEKHAIRLDLANVTKPDLEHLANTCDQATFGKDSADVLDETYRKAGKLNLDHFSSTFNLNKSGLLDIVRAHLLDGTQERKQIKADLYKLNVYGPGAFFKAHKDTPRGDNMFGSLVVVLPSPHTGGTLLIRHNGKEFAVDSATPSTHPDGPFVTYAAFYSDVEHEVSPVTSGHRITLTYNLHFVDSAFTVSQEGLAPAQDKSSINIFHKTLSDALADPAFLPEGGMLGFGLSYQYPLNATIVQMGQTSMERFRYFENQEENKKRLAAVLGQLKGSDEVLRAVSETLGLEACVRAVHKTNEGVVMMDRVIDVPEGQWDESIAYWMFKEEGGVYIEVDSADDPRSYDQTIEVQKVHWVTPRSAFNKATHSYIAYGNEASLGEVYSDLCLVVALGKAGDRATRLTN